MEALSSVGWERRIVAIEVCEPTVTT